MVYNLTASANFGMTALWDMAQHSAFMNTFAESAGDVVFERKGAPWYFEPRIPAGKTVAALAHDCYQWRARMVSRQGAIGFELTQKE